MFTDLVFYSRGLAYKAGNIRKNYDKKSKIWQQKNLKELSPM